MTTEYLQQFTENTTFSIAMIDDHVAQLTLNRPDVMNRFDATLHTEFTAALDTLRHDTQIRALVIASTGKIFSAGGDFDYILRQNTDIEERTAVNNESRELFESLINLPMPVIAAVQGPSVGLGTTIALACDAVVACRTARLSDPHVAIGLVAGDGGCVTWPQAAGMLRARRYLLSGDAIEASDAYLMGLVTDLVDTPADVIPAAQALAGRIAALPPIAVRGTKRALNQITRQRTNEVLALSLSQEALSIASEDLVEAIAAFRSKRAPVYRGR